MARQLLDLPDELLEAIISQTTSHAHDTVRFGLACKRLHQLATPSLVWRHHCLAQWDHWNTSHGLRARLAQPPLQTNWRGLYRERLETDRHARQLFESLLATQQARASRMHELAAVGTDIVDLLLRFQQDTPDDADDVLARRWFADAVLKLINRQHAVEVWDRVQRGEHVELEDALGAYDVFVLGRTPDLERTKTLLDDLAASLPRTTPGFHSLTIRDKAVSIARHLRDRSIVGISDLEDYHAIRNNFFTLALDGADHVRKRGCMPLQSVAIYCAVAGRLGVQAQPSNFPQNVHAVITAPPSVTLDGVERTERDEPSAEPERMYMDPFGQEGEVSREYLISRLAEMGAPPEQYSDFLGPTDVHHMVLRTARNILVSARRVQIHGEEALERHDPESDAPYPDPSMAEYAADWAIFMIGDTDPAMATNRRRQGLGYLLHKFRAQSDFSNDVDMFAAAAPRLLQDLPEGPRVLAWMQEFLALCRSPKSPVARPEPEDDVVRHRIGTYFEHRRFGYRGFIIGWTPTCRATADWIAQMRVDDLTRGRNQPFYNIVCTDRVKRYVAEENIKPLLGRPPRSLFRFAGKYFKRWDRNGYFVSNMRDEYPDD